MLSILTDSKPATSIMKNMNKGLTPLRSEIEASILKELCSRTGKDTCVAGSKTTRGSKAIKRLTNSAGRPPSSGTSQRGW